MNIVLIGFMGTGKSSIGKLISKKLGFTFYDSDEMIEKDVGMKIPDIFKKKGEPYFREAESRIVDMLSVLNNAVISCGGGVVLRTKNMENLEKNGIVVCLESSPEVIYKRTKNNTDRPLLQVKDPVLKIKELLSIRDPYYKRCSFCVNTSVLKAEQVVEKILSNELIKSKLK